MLRGASDALLLGTSIKAGYSGEPVDSLAIGFRIGISATDRLRFVENSDIYSSKFDENKPFMSLSERLEDKKTGLPPQTTQGLLKDDIIKPTLITGVGYTLGSIGRYFF
jgi:hypothetical protein